jgi:hypothetical protein
MNSILTMHTFAVFSTCFLAATDAHVIGPARYRLRVATVDLAGRTAVVWKEIDVPE